MVAESLKEGYPAVRPGISRLIEALIALLGLIASSPILAACALAIRLNSRGPVFFRQLRMGRRGKPFLMYKLRTMRASQPGINVTASDDDRITMVGRILRKTKLDELPELWNVVRGDMSLVGPRPEVPRYVDMNKPAWQVVLAVRPGLTDPMTLRLRNEEELMSEVAGDREKFYLDVLQPFKLAGYIEYLNLRSWKADLNVIWRTVLAVISPGLAPVPSLQELQAWRKPGR
jgi:lipopolysaccharide/colanic/teichoic acid biosynthesis glycosyltransferase